MLFALIALVVLLIVGVRLGELRWTHVLLFVALAAGGFFLFVVFKWPIIAYTGVLAAIDIVLVLVIFKGNIRVT